MSSVFIRKYVIELVILVELFNCVVVIFLFNFNIEINVLLDVLFGLYDEGMIFEVVMSIEEDFNMLEILLFFIIIYIRDEV